MDRKLWRHIPKQYSLRGLLILTALVAIGVWWFIPPPPIKVQWTSKVTLEEFDGDKLFVAHWKVTNKSSRPIWYEGTAGLEEGLPAYGMGEKVSGKWQFAGHSLGPLQWRKIDPGQSMAFDVAYRSQATAGQVGLYLSYSPDNKRTEIWSDEIALK